MIIDFPFSISFYFMFPVQENVKVEPVEKEVFEFFNIQKSSSKGETQENENIKMDNGKFQPGTIDILEYLTRKHEGEIEFTWIFGI